MVVQALIDSLSRCFGATNPPNARPNGETASTDARATSGRRGQSGAVGIGAREGGRSVGGNNAGVGADADSSPAADARRRAGRVSLHDREWDELFDCAVDVVDDSRNNGTAGANRRGPSGMANAAADQDEMDEPSSAAAAAAAAAKVTAAAGGGTSASSRSPGQSQNEKKKRAPPEVDMTYAEVLAKARQAANPSRHRTPTKRKTAAQKKADIFRSKNFNSNSDKRSSSSNNHNSSSARGDNKSSTAGGTPAGSFASRFLSSHEGVAKALCFANPIRDSQQEAEEAVAAEDSADVRSTMSDADTLNTCEDTITSTLYFDAKLSHIVEKRPPMPLFEQFQVNTTESASNDELRKIVASDSHNSLNMIRLFQEHQVQEILTGNSASPTMNGGNGAKGVTPEPQRQRGLLFPATAGGGQFRQLPTVVGGTGKPKDERTVPSNHPVVQILSLESTTEEEITDDDGNGEGDGDSAFENAEDDQGSNGRPRRRHSSASRGSSSRRNQPRGGSSSGGPGNSGSVATNSTSATMQTNKRSDGANHQSKSSPSSYRQASTAGSNRPTNDPASHLEREHTRRSRLEVICDLKKKQHPPPPPPPPPQSESPTSSNQQYRSQHHHARENSTESVPPPIKLLTESSASASTGRSSTAPSTPTSSRSMSTSRERGGGRSRAGNGTVIVELTAGGGGGGRGGGGGMLIA